ncbi:hypothetical protein KSS87_017153 [Heliosperma pusillum]|nr:hypothetical protein KSS87_017153 [Heliosperma pusillum]
MLSNALAHPWFNGIAWDKLYQMEAAFIPEVNDELDTQNFENFDEVYDESQAPSNQPAQGSFLNLLPTRPQVPENQREPL